MGKWFAAHRADWRLAVRITVAVTLAHFLVLVYALPQGYWAVITALLVTTSSVGGSVAVGVDRFIGTIGGVAFVIGILFVMPHESPLDMGLTIVVTVLPLALLAAVKPSFRVAPVTAIIILLAPTPGVSPLHSAVDRVLEILIGSFIGVAVSIMVLPARAHSLVAESAGKTLVLFAELLRAILEKEHGEAETAPLHASIRASVNRVETLTGEAKRERDSHLAVGADPDPLGRTLRRLRGDFVMAGRAVTTPLPPDIAARLKPVIDVIVETSAEFMTSAAAALSNRRDAPSLARTEEAIKGYDTAIADLRREGLLRELSGDQVSRVFTLGFAFDQMRHNFRDLVSRIGEFRKA
jgi:uncharacterized membrane protein YccC